MEKVRLGDVAIEKREAWTGSTQGVPIVGLEHLVPGEVTLSSWDFDTDNTFSKMFRKDQVLLGRRRVYLKKAVIAPFDGICSGDITVIEAIPGKISSRLLPFVIQNDRFFDYAMQGSAGSLSPRVKWEHLKDYEFNLPDYEEQDCLADKLWSALKLRESYQSLLQATDEMVKSRFIELFGNPVTNSKKWPSKPLSIVAPETPSSDRQTGTVWVLNLDMVESQTGKVIDKVFDDSSNLNSVAPFDESNVLFSKLRPYLNKVVIPEGKGYATTELVPLRPQEIYLRKEFLAHLLRTEEFVSFADSIATGTKMPRMPMSALRSFECILPPISLQEDFIIIAKQADKSKFELKQAIEKIDKVMRALMQ